MKQILKAFFYDSEGNFQPIYYYAFMFLHFTMVIVVLRIIDSIMNEDKIDAPLIATMMAYVLGLIGLYSVVKFKKNGRKNEKSIEEDPESN